MYFRRDPKKIKYPPPQIFDIEKVKKNVVADDFADSLAQALGESEVGVGKDDHELVSAIAGGNVRFPHCGT